MSSLTKSMLRDQIKTRGAALLQGEQEADYFRRVFELAREYDYDGILDLSRSQPEVFKPFFKTLEQQAEQILQQEEPAASFLFFLVRRLFAPDDEQSDDEGFAGETSLTDKQVLELYLLLNSRPFGLTEIRILRTRINDWKLDRLRDRIWEIGLTRFFNDRYRKLKNLQTPDITIREIFGKARLFKLLDENELLDNYVFDRLGRSKSMTGMKSDLYLEKKVRQEAIELRDRLTQAFEAPEFNYGYIKKVFEDLHMEREIEFIERHGVNSLKEHLDDRWREGAGEVARIHDFRFDEAGEGGAGVPVSRINRSFMSQASQSARGKSFLHWEAILNRRSLSDEASCHFLTENFVAVRLLQEEGAEHVLLVQINSERERDRFISRCLSAFFSSGNPGRAARGIVEACRESKSGAIRLRKAIRNALIALPVVGVISFMLAWIYNITMNNMGEGAVLGLVVGLLGVSIAARNGYTQKINPEEHAEIPDHIVLHRMVARIAEKESEGILEITGDA